MKNPENPYSLLLLMAFSFFLPLFSSAQNLQGLPYEKEAALLISKLKYPKAFKVYDEAIKGFKKSKDWDRYFYAIRQRGSLYLRLEKNKKGINLINSAIKEYLDLFGKTNSLELGELRKLQAEFYYKMRNYAEAQTASDSAIANFDRVGADDRVGAALWVLAEVYHRTNKHEAALRSSVRALELLEKDTINNTKEIGRALEQLGNIYKHRSHLDLAIEYFGKALKYATQATDSITMAHSCFGLGTAYARQMNYEQGLIYTFKALDYYREYLGNESHSVAVAYNGIGNVYFSRGDYSKALEYFNLGFELSKKVRGIEAPYTATLLMNTGVMYQFMEEFDNSLQVYERVIELQKKHTVRDYDHFKVYRNMGITYLKSGNPLAAQQKFLEAQKIGEKLLEANSMIWVDLFLDLAKTEKSLSAAEAWVNKAFKKCLENKKNIMDLEKQDFAITKNSLSLMSVVMAQTNYALERYKSSQNHLDLQRAWQFADKSLKLLDYLWLTLNSEESKLKLMQKARPHLKCSATIGRLVYEESQEEEQLEWLLHVVEKHKSLLLTDLLNTKRTKIDLGIPREALNKESELLEEIAKEKQQLIQFENNEQKAFRRHNRLYELNQTLADLRQEFTEKYPRYRQLNLDQTNISISEIQKNLPDRNSALIEYLFDESGLIILTITKDKIYYKHQELDSEFSKQLETQLYSLNYSLDSKVPIGKKKEIYHSYTETAHQLYQQLLEPVLGQLPTSISNLIIVPDGQLGYLPFDLLLTKPVEQDESLDYRQLPFLLKKYVIQYEYSIRLMLEFQTEKTFNGGQLLAFAPTFSGEVEQPDGQRGEMDSLAFVNAFPGLDNKYGRLTFNIPEVEKIANTVAGEIIIGEQASEAKFKEMASQFDILHLATHAYVNDLYPDYSHLVFSKEVNAHEDRFLYAYELYNLYLNASLVVLSACDSGAGKIQEGEGIMSISRAFKYAGCPNVVTSLWKANDQSTHDLMLLFYKNLKQGLGKAGALNKAKLEFLSSSDKWMTAPNYWGNFVLIGDNTPIDFKKQDHLPGSIKWLILTISLMVLLWWGFRRLSLA